MTEPRARTTGLVALGLCIAAAWMLQHRYWGITHDSIIYSLLALARMDPAQLSHDVFLRFGSQDRFTWFSPIFSSLIREFDLGPAAALLTFLSECALYLCAWLLARRVMPPATALLATGLFVVVPGYYGSGHLFSYAEDFLTPRLAAGALCLGSLAQALKGRFVLALACILIAFVVHPIVSVGGAMTLAITALGPLRLKRVAAVCSAVLAGVMVSALLLPIGPWQRFDPEWFRILTETTPNLFVAHWSFDDWVRVAAAANVLLLGSLSRGPEQLRTICAAALITGAAGLACSLALCDWLHAVLPTQGQPWRCLWISTAISVLASPAIAIEYWTRGRLLGRSALIFAAGALLLRADSGGFFGIAASLACGLASRRWLEVRFDRYVVLAACGYLLIALVAALAEGISSAVMAVGALAAVWGLQHAFRQSLPKTAALVALSGIACLAAAPAAFRSWTTPAYSPALRASFRQWAEGIRPGAEILWPGAPLETWYLLNRPSYWSHPQLAGVVFSRGAALTLDRRTDLLRDALASSTSFKNSDFVTPLRHKVPATLESLGPEGLRKLCSDPELGYVVSGKVLGPSSRPALTADPARPGNRLYIYDCKDYHKLS